MPSSPVLALVGMGPGLGRSLARKWGREGYRLALIGHDSTALGTSVEALRDEGFEARGYAAHAGDRVGLEAAFRELGTELGDPETLIFNASVSHEAPPSELGIGHLESDLRANVTGLLLAIQAVLPSMKAAGRGSLLLTGGGSALKPSATAASLGVGKAAQRSLFLSLAKELEGSALRVGTLTICGFVQPGTPFDPEDLARQMWELHTQDLALPEIERIVV
ncbi:MAG TPA: SDR family NAD(P)-dependent oxidoreductase [Holophagaceae bacterium]|nr:SDR family NAD(P)-dependent oxidoreductase [Holophagaceae bacterium]